MESIKMNDVMQAGIKSFVEKMTKKQEKTANEAVDFYKSEEEYNKGCEFAKKAISEGYPKEEAEEFIKSSLKAKKQIWEATEQDKVCLIGEILMNSTLETKERIIGFVNDYVKDYPQKKMMALIEAGLDLGNIDNNKKEEENEQK